MTNSFKLLILSQRILKMEQLLFRKLITGEVDHDYGGLSCIFVLLAEQYSRIRPIITDWSGGKITSDNLLVEESSWSGTRTRPSSHSGTMRRPEPTPCLRRRTVFAVSSSENSPSNPFPGADLKAMFILESHYTDRWCPKIWERGHYRVSSKTVYTWFLPFLSSKSNPILTSRVSFEN